MDGLRPSDLNCAVILLSGCHVLPQWNRVQERLIWIWIKFGLRELLSINGIASVADFFSGWSSDQLGTGNHLQGVYVVENENRVESLITNVRLLPNADSELTLIRMELTRTEASFFRSNLRVCVQRLAGELSSTASRRTACPIFRHSPRFFLSRA
ncbi:hypothetical protein B0H13DRAFT_685546 [Mycena leptocephala]|nr:hypothetical protein B0H13DRAFT_685546 [Mycena leptocephala]